MSTIMLREDLVEKLREIARRENRPLDDVVAALITEYQAESAWEEAVLDEALGDAMSPDGSIDFDKLRAAGQTMTLDDFLSLIHI